MLLTSLDLPCSQAVQQAVAQIMHQTVRGFFLRPHRSVINSHFKNISAQPAREMIAITCIRYLDLHYRELGNIFSNAVCAGAFGWSSEDIDELVRYLDRRPFIKYSLEFLMALKEDTGVYPDIPMPFLDLTTNLRLQNCPSMLQICLLGGLTNFSTSTQRVQELNHLLGIAAESGFIIAVGNLLAAGAECSTALHGASRGGHVTTVRLLLDRGADIEANNSNTRTPLHLPAAAWRGHGAAVGLLPDRGAAIEAKAFYGKTPLLAATVCGHEVTVGLLLDRGADIEANDFGGLTPLHIATWCGHEATVGLLLDRGADIEAKDSSGRTPLHMAARCGHVSVIGLLHSRGADIEAKGSNGQTPLHMAAWDGHGAAVGLLLDRGADIEARGSDGQTPLHMTVCH